MIGYHLLVHCTFELVLHYRGQSFVKLKVGKNVLEYCISSPCALRDIDPCAPHGLILQHFEYLFACLLCYFLLVR